MEFEYKLRISFNDEKKIAHLRKVSDGFCDQSIVAYKDLMPLVNAVLEKNYTDKLNEKYPIMSEYVNNKNSQKFIDSCKCRCCNENTYNENVELLDWASWSHTECLEHAAKKSWKKLTGKDLEL